MKLNEKLKKNEAYACGQANPKTSANKNAGAQFAVKSRGPGAG